MAKADYHFQWDSAEQTFPIPKGKALRMPRKLLRNRMKVTQHYLDRLKAIRRRENDRGDN